MSDCEEEDPEIVPFDNYVAVHPDNMMCFTPRYTAKYGTHHSVSLDGPRGKDTLEWSFGIFEN